MAADVRRIVVGMIDRARPRPHRRRSLGHRHPRHALRRRARRRPGRPDAPGARPLHPQQGPLRRRALRDARPLRLLPRAELDDLHGAAVARSTGTPTATRCRASRPTPARSATASRSAVGMRARGQAARARLAHVRRARRRRAAGGQQLGGGDDRRPLRARQPDRDRRPQPPPAGRAHRGHQASSSRWPTSGRASASRCARSTGTTHRAARGLRAVQHRQAGRGHRQHDQGQGRLVHGGPRRVAPQGARPPTRSKPPSRSSADDLPLAHDAQTYDCRKAFADELIELARADERIVAVCNDSVGSSNLAASARSSPSA